MTFNFFTLNNGTGTINNIDIRHKKVYDTNMEPVPITNRGDSYNRDRKTKIGTGYTTKCGHIITINNSCVKCLRNKKIRENIKKKGKVKNGLRKNCRTGNSVCGR